MSIKDPFPIFGISAFKDKQQSEDSLLYHELHGERFIDKPHKHDFFLFLLFEKGNGTHSIDFVDYKVAGHQMHLLFPDQVHSWRLGKATAGYQLMISRPVFETFADSLRFSFVLYQHHPVIDLPEKVFQKLLYEFRSVEEELNQKPIHWEMIHLRARLIAQLVSREAEQKFKDLEVYRTKPVLFKYHALVDAHFKEQKSTLKEIEERFDKDVARFSNLETGQQTTLDAAFNMELITDGIVAAAPHMKKILDIGCGAGNYPVKLLSKTTTNPDVTLVDLSQPMLDKAAERVQPLTTGKVTTIRGDFRTATLEENSYCAIIATAVLHHLRNDADWEAAFAKFFSLLKPGGSIWIFDLVAQDHPAMQQLLFNQHYGRYLSDLKDIAYRDHVFAYIEKEDTPRSVIYQTNLLRQVGFKTVELLHKNLCFASFAAFK